MPAEKDAAISLFREQLQDARQLLGGTMADVSQQEAQWFPPGLANSLGATYAHIVISEDGTANGLLKGAVPLFAGNWAGKIGVSELPPMAKPNSPGFPDWSSWSRRVKVDLAKMREYAKAVYSATEAHSASLTDDDLSRPISLAALGLGESTVAYVLTNGLLGHVFSHTGEISCLKGLQGKRGYPV